MQNFNLFFRCGYSFSTRSTISIELSGVQSLIKMYSTSLNDCSKRERTHFSIKHSTLYTGIITLILLINTIKTNYEIHLELFSINILITKEVIFK